MTHLPKLPYEWITFWSRVVFQKKLSGYLLRIYQRRIPELAFFDELLDAQKTLQRAYAEAVTSSFSVYIKHLSLMLLWLLFFVLIGLLTHFSVYIKFLFIVGWTALIYFWLQALTVSSARKIVRKMLRKKGVILCIECGYPQNGLLSATCPECGSKY